MSDTRQALVAEFFDKQYWQFISLDEWLQAPQTTTDGPQAHAGRNEKASSTDESGAADREGK